MNTEELYRAARKARRMAQCDLARLENEIHDAQLKVKLAMLDEEDAADNHIGMGNIQVGSNR